jgi:hypothetical protein
MSDKDKQGLMRRHPPWFLFDFHPIRFAKRTLEEEQRDKKEPEADKK